MARNHFGRLLIIGLSFWLAASVISYPCLGQEVSRFAASRSRYALALTPSNQAVPNNTDINTSRIIELVPAEYRKRYLKWRDDYLSTEAGRNEWSRYALDPNFTLTIVVSKERAEGAIVDDFRWDDNGRLIAATIMLGNKLDSGYPSAVHYPITCSLAPGNLPPEVRGTILAAAKLAHEFGHLDQIIGMDGRLYQLQNRLMTIYNEIFSVNGRDSQDPRLLELAETMEGTPVSIKQDRESWAEIGALFYLRERLAKNRKIKMPEPIKQAIKDYYLTYPGRVE